MPNSLHAALYNWLSHTLGLAYLDPQEVEESFVFDIKPDAPSDDDACDKYADYLLSTYVLSDSTCTEKGKRQNDKNSRTVPEISKKRNRTS